MAMVGSVLLYLQNKLKIKKTATCVDVVGPYLCIKIIEVWKTTLK